MISLDKYRRIHIARFNRDSYLDAARFLVNSLLLSHGIRRDTLSIVGLVNTIRLAPVDKLRHLRPDAESSTGWIRAVLEKGKAKGLGAVLLQREALEDLIAGVEIGRTQIIVENCNIEPTLPLSLEFPVTIYYGFRAMRDGIGVCLKCPQWCSPIILNIALDRIEAGLPAP